MAWFWRLIQDIVRLSTLCSKGRPHVSPTTSQDGGMSNSSLIGISLLKCLYGPCSVANSYFLPKPEFPSSFFFLTLFIPLGFFPPCYCLFLCFHWGSVHTRIQQPWEKEIYQRIKSRSGSIHLFNWVFPNKLSVQEMFRNIEQSQLFLYFLLLLYLWRFFSYYSELR